MTGSIAATLAGSLRKSVRPGVYIAHGQVVIDRAMPHHPLSSYTTWFGVALQQEQHGDTGIGTSRLPRVTPDISLWGWARVSSRFP